MTALLTPPGSSQTNAAFITKFIALGPLKHAYEVVLFGRFSVLVQETKDSLSPRVQYIKHCCQL